MRVEIDEAEIAKFLSWNGPYGRSFERLAKECTWRSKQIANRRTGVMASSIHYDKSSWHKGLVFHVGSPIYYSLYVHEGTKPHEIRAKYAPMLVFFWPKVGRVVHFKKVNHPGTRPYRFLTKAVERGIRSWERGG